DHQGSFAEGLSHRDPHESDQPYARQDSAPGAGGSRHVGVKLQRLQARDAAELATAFEAASRARADLVNVYGDPLTLGQGAGIAELAMRHRLPTLHFFREGVEAGGLLSFGPDLPHIWRNVGKYVDKILKGAKPGDIPVEQPSKYELVINMKTAKALGLTIPQSLLLRADQVIE